MVPDVKLKQPRRTHRTPIRPAAVGLSRVPEQTINGIKSTQRGQHGASALETNLSTSLLHLWRIVVLVIAEGVNRQRRPNAKATLDKIWVQVNESLYNYVYCGLKVVFL